MPTIEDLTSVLGTAISDADVFYIGLPGDADPDRKIAKSEMATIFSTYEAGVWTPTFVAGYEDLAAATGISVAEAHYRRFGDMVHIWGEFSVLGVAGNTAYSSNGASIALGGLPYSMDRLPDGFGQVGNAYARSAINSSQGTFFIVTGESADPLYIRIAILANALGGADAIDQPITFTAWYRTGAA